MNNLNQDLITRSRRISQELRRRRVALETQRTGSDQEPSTQPDIYYDWAPTGWYPIIAFRSVPCDRFLLGQCAPCMYSARPRPKQPRAKLHASLIEQLEWVLKNFSQVVASRQSGSLLGYNIRQVNAGKTYLLQISGESSLLRDAEIPPTYRKAILGRLIEFQEATSINLHVMIETRPEHLLESEAKGELASFESHFSALNVVVNMGYEAQDPFIRNFVFGKGLDDDVFEQAILIAKARDLDPAAFVFAGGFSLTDAEILTEVRATLMKLETMGVFANVMVPNLQSYTIQDVLYEEREYELPEPFFVLELAALLLDFSPVRPKPVTPFSWFLGGIESDPEPRMNVFTNPRRRTSDTVSDQIYNAVRNLVISGDRNRFTQELTELRATAEGLAYQAKLREVPTHSIAARTEASLIKAEVALDNYHKKMAPGIRLNREPMRL